MACVNTSFLANTVVVICTALVFWASPHTHLENAGTQGCAGWSVAISIPLPPNFLRLRAYLQRNKAETKHRKPKSSSGNFDAIKKSKNSDNRRQEEWKSGIQKIPKLRERAKNIQLWKGKRKGMYFFNEDNSTQS